MAEKSIKAASCPETCKWETNVTREIHGLEHAANVACLRPAPAEPARSPTCMPALSSAGFAGTGLEVGNKGGQGSLAATRSSRTVSDRLDSANSRPLAGSILEGPRGGWRGPRGRSPRGRPGAGAGAPAAWTSPPSSGGPRAMVVGLVLLLEWDRQGVVFKVVRDHRSASVTMGSTSTKHIAHGIVQFRHPTRPTPISATASLLVVRVLQTWRGLSVPACSTKVSTKPSAFRSNYI